MNPCLRHQFFPDKTLRELVRDRMTLRMIGWFALLGALLL